MVRRFSPDFPHVFAGDKQNTRPLVRQHLAGLCWLPGRQIEPVEVPTGLAYSCSGLAKMTARIVIANQVQTETATSLDEEDEAVEVLAKKASSSSSGSEDGISAAAVVAAVARLHQLQQHYVAAAAAAALQEPPDSSSGPSSPCCTTPSPGPKTSFTSAADCGRRVRILLLNKKYRFAMILG